MDIKLNDLKSKIEASSYLFNGDLYETRYFDLFQTFENHEIFWKEFIVPTTKRIIGNGNVIHGRDNISNDISEINQNHYSVFIFMMYVKNCISQNHISYFENFYSNIVSVIDNVDLFLEKVYLLECKCYETKIEVLNKLDENEFVEIARTWYKENYQAIWENYLKKGKYSSPKLPRRTDIIEEFYNKYQSQAYKNFKKTAKMLKEYRNVIIHNHILAKIDIHSNYFVPKNGKIGNYKHWHSIPKVYNNRVQFENDFIEIKQKMVSDFKELCDKMNELWELPITRLRKLIEGRNKKYFDMIDLNIIE